MNEDLACTVTAGPKIPQEGPSIRQRGHSGENEDPRDTMKLSALGHQPDSGQESLLIAEIELHRMVCLSRRATVSPKV